MAKVLLLIPPGGFRDNELADSKKALAEKGFSFTVASARTSPSLGVLWTKEKPEAKITEVKPEAYSALLVIGGPGVSYYYKDAPAHQLIKAFLDAGKPVGAMDLAVTVLARANLLSGRKVACWTLEKKLVESKGATVSDQPVEADNNLVTMSKPAYLQKFLETFTSKL